MPPLQLLNRRTAGDRGYYWPLKQLYCSALLLPSLRTAASSPSSTVATCGATREGYHAYPLVGEESISSDTKLLRFALPTNTPTLGLSLPSCLKVRLHVGEATMSKSYSPISLPEQPGFVELLVKGYPPRPSGHPPIHGHPGGVAAHLNNLTVGGMAELELKAPRVIHGAPYSPNRWTELGLVAGGTGIAPLLQMIRSLLGDEAERTNISLVFANRHADDILMKGELDALAAAHPTRFRVRYVLSSPPADGSWSGGSGWITADDLRSPHLPSPRPQQADGGVMIMVCGRDEFIASMGGMTQRAPPPPGKKKGPKIQGALTGVLAEIGFTEDTVYKF